MTHIPDLDPSEAQLAMALITAMGTGSDELVRPVLIDVMRKPGVVMHLAAFAHAAIKAVAIERGVDVDHALEQVGLILERGEGS